MDIISDKQLVQLLSVEHLYLNEVKYKRHIDNLDSVKPPLEIKTKFAAQSIKKDGAVTVFIGNFELLVRESKAKSVKKPAVIFSIDISLTIKATIPKDLLNEEPKIFQGAFLHAAYPFLRECVANAMQRTNLPPYFLPIALPLVKDEP